MQANALLAVLRYGRRQPQSRMNQLVATSTTIEQTHQGPLPSPEQLEEGAERSEVFLSFGRWHDSSVA